jgi:saccharopine dehydrogenase-like NADP-dependent oxidoreductase
MLQNPRVVVFGGTGHFGARICRRLARKPELDLVVTSRTLSRAELLVAAITREGPAANVSAAALDQDAPGLPDELARLDADVVIHTAGPYQGQDYRVAEACVSAGSHYVDLADGREFVSGFDRLDAAAKRAGVMLVSGASTLPGGRCADLAVPRLDRTDAAHRSCSGGGQPVATHDAR